MDKLMEVHPRLVEISDYIHDNPELGHEEFKAARILCDEIAAAGFSVEEGVADLPTAFVGTYAPHPQDGPTVAVVAEYDALPVIGHGCGHNVIATGALGAALALKPFMDSIGGTLKIIGTPAEDTTGDKVVMLEKGVFDGVDFAMQCHPNDRTMPDAKFLAIHSMKINFYGVASHASRAPEKGISALDAMMLGFTGTEFLRGHVTKDVSIAGIITSGGTASNSIPDFASAEFGIRSLDIKTLRDVVTRVENCFRGAELMTGARLEIIHDKWLHSNVRVPLLNETVMKYARMGGAEQILPQETMASTDFSNVTTALPAARLDIAFAPVGTSTHSQGFADAGKEPMAHRAIASAAFAMAATAYDLFTKPELAAEIRRQWEEITK